MSGYSIFWGLTLWLDEAYLDRPYMQALHAMLYGHSWVMGGPMALLGVVGLWALVTKRRYIRAQCACGCSVIWAVMGAYFVWIVPPIWLGLATYGGAALAEGWVYLRVSARLDGPGHGRVSPRHPRG